MHEIPSNVCSVCRYVFIPIIKLHIQESITNCRNENDKYNLRLLLVLIMLSILNKKYNNRWNKNYLTDF